MIGGHPRMLELLDALLRGGEGRLAEVTTRLQELLAKAGLELDAEVASLDQGLRQAVQLGTRDVMLEELLAVARADGTDEALLQLAVSNLPVSPDGLVRMTADGSAAAGTVDAEPVAKALDRLARLSLVFRLPGGAGWVHRWTAEGLAALSDEDVHRERCNRAGRYRWWRVGNESHALEDAVEAVRNHLDGRDFDAATGVAFACFDALRRFQQSAGIAALASEVLESLPVDHGGYAVVADEEAEAHLALGWTERAMERYQALLAAQQRRVEAEPERADYQRDLSVSFNKMGDLYVALGQGKKARDAYQSSLSIAQRLAEAEPERADYQVDLAISLMRVGAMKEAGGRPELERALSILERLQSEGRLAPVDQPKIEDLRSMLDPLE
jgi:tetratricopeptide (TPR) repeat protein